MSSEEDFSVEASSEEIGDAEACRRLNHDDLLQRVRCSTTTTTVPLTGCTVYIAVYLAIIYAAWQENRVGSSEHMTGGHQTLTNR